AEEMLPEVAGDRHHPAHAERGADLLGLPLAARTRAHHLLQGYDVRVELADDLGDARWHRSPVHSTAAMDVVGGNPEVALPPRGLRLAHSTSRATAVTAATIASRLRRA